MKHSTYNTFTHKHIHLDILINSLLIMVPYVTKDASKDSATFVEHVSNLTGYRYTYEIIQWGVNSILKFTTTVFDIDKNVLKDNMFLIVFMCFLRCLFIDKSTTLAKLRKNNVVPI